jgi:aerobic-type carbon monoxide dehydrogenase small subunit (CoxS/CutS family)
MATKERISLNVNNKSYDLEVDPNMPLLYALRNELDVTGPKFGCGFEGLGTAENPHPVQQAFIEEAVPQCGLCLSGWVMTSVAMLEENPRRSDAEIRQSLSSLKCRCGTHMSILRAVNRAAKAMA